MELRLLAFRPLLFPLRLIRLPLLQPAAFLPVSATLQARLLLAKASWRRRFQNFLSSDLSFGLALCLAAFSSDRRQLAD
jgi:hypothetical protein